MFGNNKIVKGYRDSKGVKRVKMFILIVTLFLIVVDVIAFAFVKLQLPTVSRVVLHSVPLFFFVTWIAGIATISVFFPKIRNLSVASTAYRKVATFSIALLMVIGGFVLHKKGKDVQCGELATPTEISKLSYWHLIKVECILSADKNYSEVDCDHCEYPEGCTTKFNLKVSAKLALYLFGLLWGFFVWPQREYEEEQANNGPPTSQE